MSEDEILEDTTPRAVPKVIQVAVTATEEGWNRTILLDNGHLYVTGSHLQGWHRIELPAECET